MFDFAQARAKMVESQIRTNRVWDEELIAAFREVSRESFVPSDKRSVAYVDEDLPLGNGRYLMEAMVLARLLQAATPGPGDIALDVGCGSGYATAILARLCATVVGLECDPSLAKRAIAILSETDVMNAEVVEGPLGAGHPKQGPYNVILLNGAVAELPMALTDQLADGGRLVTVVRCERAMGRATLTRRIGDVVSSRTLFDAATPLLPGFAREPSFVF